MLLGVVAGVWWNQKERRRRDGEVEVPVNGLEAIRRSKGYVPADLPMRRGSEPEVVDLGDRLTKTTPIAVMRLKIRGRRRAPPGAPVAPAEARRRRIRIEALAGGACLAVILLSGPAAALGVPQDIAYGVAFGALGLLTLLIGVIMVESVANVGEPEDAHERRMAGLLSGGGIGAVARAEPGQGSARAEPPGQSRDETPNNALDAIRRSNEYVPPDPPEPSRFEAWVEEKEQAQRAKEQARRPDPPPEPEVSELLDTSPVPPSPRPALKHAIGREERFERAMPTVLGGWALGPFAQSECLSSSEDRRRLQWQASARAGDDELTVIAAESSWSWGVGLRRKHQVRAAVRDIARANLGESEVVILDLPRADWPGLLEMRSSDGATTYGMFRQGRWVFVVVGHAESTRVVARELSNELEAHERVIPRASGGFG